MPDLITQSVGSVDNDSYPSQLFNPVSQSFTGDGRYLSELRIRLTKSGSPGGTFIGRLRAHTGTYGNGGYPSGSDLAVSGTINASSVSGTQEVTLSFTGANRVLLVNGTRYTLLLDFSSLTGHNASNRFLVESDSGASRHSGNLAAYYSGSWTASTTDRDFIFSVWAVSPPTLTTSAPTSVTQTTATGNGNITDLDGENATERGFVYMVGTTGNPTLADSVAQDSGSFSTGSYTKGLTGLQPGTSYRIRAFATSKGGTAYGTTQTFQTEHSNPLQPSDLNPSGGIGVNSEEPTLTWQFNPGTANDTQTAYQVIVIRQSDSVEMYDSGKVTSTDEFINIPSGANLVFGVSYQWKVRTYDTGDRVSTYSSNALFKPSEKPTATISTPIDESTIETNVPTIEWVYDDPEETAQTAYRVKILNDDKSVTIYDSGLLVSSDNSHDIPAGYLFTTETYFAQVTVRDSDNILSDLDEIEFTVQFVAPKEPLITGSVLEAGVVDLDIELQAPENNAWYSDYIKIYRKIEGEPLFELIKENLPVLSKVISDFESLTGWTESEEALTPALGSPKYGMSALAMGTTGAGDAVYYKSLAVGDWNLYNTLQSWIYVEDNTEFDKIRIKFGTNLSNYYQVEIENSVFTDEEWTALHINDNDFVSTGSPDKNTFNFVQIEIIGASGVITEGNVRIDQMRLIADSYNFKDYNTANNTNYIYAASTYSNTALSESVRSETDLLTIAFTEEYVNVYLVPIGDEDNIIKGWMDGNSVPSWVHKTETKYYQTKGQAKPTPVFEGTQRYREGSVEIRFFDYSNDGDALSVAELVEEIKNNKPILLRTWWGRNYYISIDGELSIRREPGIGWYIEFSFTEMNYEQS